MAPVLSVIVPIYNMARYLDACLASLAGQTFRDIEVICVDDGSEDDSRRIAERYAATDSRFQVICQENRGLGPSRNRGISRATGEFLSFVDADDMVPENAFEVLIASLRSTGSDIACGAVHRFDSTGSVPSWLHKEIYEESRPKTHIRRYPALAANRTIWNAHADARAGGDLPRRHRPGRDRRDPRPRPVARGAADRGGSRVPGPAALGRRLRPASPYGTARPVPRRRAASGCGADGAGAVT